MCPLVTSLTPENGTETTDEVKCEKHLNEPRHPLDHRVNQESKDPSNRLPSQGRNVFDKRSLMSPLSPCSSIKDFM